MKRETTQTLLARKADPNAPKIVAVTAYDYSFARLMDEFVDVLLVGDSLGMVVQGNANTLSVTMDQMVYHVSAVSRAARRSHLVADMPFLSYQTSAEDAIRNAGRLLAEGGAQSVKLEGGVAIVDTVKRLVDVGIPVMGHVGLTPQSVHAFGGYKIQGKTDISRERILQDAKALEQAGVYSLVLEGLPSDLAKAITLMLKIPTIGIGAGVHCDGQILVSYDLLGMNPDFSPKFVKAYANLAAIVRGAIGEYAAEVREGTFPDSNHGF